MRVKFSKDNSEEVKKVLSHSFDLVVYLLKICYNFYRTESLVEDLITEYQFRNLSIIRYTLNLKNEANLFLDISIEHYFMHKRLQIWLVRKL